MTTLILMAFSIDALHISKEDYLVYSSVDHAVTINIIRGLENTGFPMENRYFISAMLVQ